MTRVNHIDRVYSIDVFMEELDPTRRMELQRNVELLDKELSKWSDNLPSESTPCFEMKQTLIRLPSGVQVTSNERARCFHGSCALLTLLFDRVHPASQLPAHQQGAHSFSDFYSQSILLCPGLHCARAFHQECGAIVAPSGLLHSEPL